MRLLNRHPGRHGAPYFYAGWAGFALFGTFAFVDGHADLSYAVLHVLVAAAVCTWHVMTTGKAALVVGAVLGSLFALQMGFFVISGNFLSEETLDVRVVDGFGLLAAGLILVGVVLGLRGGRASPSDSDQSADYVRSPTST